MSLDLITHSQGFLGQVLQPQQHRPEGQLVQVDSPRGCAAAKATQDALLICNNVNGSSNMAALGQRQTERMGLLLQDLVSAYCMQKCMFEPTRQPSSPLIRR